MERTDNVSGVFILRQELVTMEDRLQFGANKWREDLFEGHGEDMEEVYTQSKQNWRFSASDKWDTITSGYRRWRGIGWWPRWNGISLTRHLSPPHGQSTFWQEKERVARRWATGYGTRRFHGKHTEDSSKRMWAIFHARPVSKNGASTRMGICGLCTRSREMDLLLGGRPTRVTTGHLQISVYRLQAPTATGDHNACFQQVQNDMSKSRSVNKEWQFVSKGTEFSLGKFVSEYFTPLTRDIQPGVVSDEDTAENLEVAKEEVMKKVRGNKNRDTGADSLMVDEKEVERSFWLSRPDRWVINKKMKNSIGGVITSQWSVMLSVMLGDEQKDEENRSPWI